METETSVTIICLNSLKQRLQYVKIVAFCCLFSSKVRKTKEKMKTYETDNVYLVSEKKTTNLMINVHPGLLTLEKLLN